MDQDSLVKDQIGAGSQLIAKFNKYAKLQAAFWLKESDTGNWFLYLVSDQINDSNFNLAYGEVNRILRAEAERCLDPMEIKVAGVEDSVAKAVLAIQQEVPITSVTRLRNRRLGDLTVDEVYLYPLIKAKDSRRKTGKR